MTAIICGTIMLMSLIKAIFSGRRRNENRDLDEEETETLSEIWRGLQKMEQRIENLETILVKNERRREQEFERRV
jgi:phage shock protein B